MLGAAIDVVRADVAKHEDGLTGVWILFDVERKDVFPRYVTFPDARVALHLADAQ